MSVTRGSGSEWRLGAVLLDRARAAGCGAVLAALLGTVLLGTVGCGAEADSSHEPLGSLEQPLQPANGWRLWSLAPNNAGSTATFADSPGVCLATPDGVVIVGEIR